MIAIKCREDFWVNSQDKLLKLRLKSAGGRPGKIVSICVSSTKWQRTRSQEVRLSVQDVEPNIN